MRKNFKRIVTYSLIGTIYFSGQTLAVNAAELPAAGIDVVLNDFYQTSNDNEDITNLLEAEKSEYEDLGISKVNNYVNIRKKPTKKSKVLGKLYSNSAATILEEKGDWYKVKSGSVTGYINNKYLVTEEEKVEKLAKKVGDRIGTVTTTTLKVREKASLKAPVVTLVPIEEELEVLKEVDGWVKVSLDSDVVGYVSSDYVDLRTEFKEAESIAEEKARLKAEAAKRKAREEERLREIAAREQRTNSVARSSATKTYVKSSSTNKSVSNGSVSSRSSNVSSSTASANRQSIVNYALKFVGNPYVWGGTSLTNGTDCSGFTQSVYRNFGISIPRVSRDQANGGRTVSLSNVLPGDLIFYTSGGSINHVALYIGGGQVVHASNPRTGIRQPYKAVSYLN